MNTTYELIFLLHKEEMIQTLKDIIASFNGTVVKEEAWGEKTLAYPIRKKDTAFFFEWKITLPTASLNDFKKKLSFEDEMVRYLLLKEEEEKKPKSAKKQA